MAIVERFKQELMYGLSAGTKKSGRNREVAVSGGSTVLVLHCRIHSNKGLMLKMLPLESLYSSQFNCLVFTTKIACRETSPEFLHENLQLN